MDSRGGRAALGLTLAAIVALVLHLEWRMSAQTSEIRALSQELTPRAADAERGPTAPATPWAPPAYRSAIDRDTVQAIARAVVDLQGQRAAALASASAHEADGPPPRTVEQETAVANATDVATRAIASGRLSRDDVVKMRESMANGQATGAERDALRSQIATAINAQKLAPEDPGFIYP